MTVIFDPPELSEMVPLTLTLPVYDCEPVVLIFWLRAIRLLVRLRLLPLVNDVALPTEITSEVALVKLTVRLITKVANDAPNPNEEFESVPLLSFTRHEKGLFHYIWARKWQFRFLALLI